jgi:hypothetical protein
MRVSESFFWLLRCVHRRAGVLQVCSAPLLWLHGHIGGWAFPLDYSFPPSSLASNGGERHKAAAYAHLIAPAPQKHTGGSSAVLSLTGLGSTSQHAHAASSSPAALSQTPAWEAGSSISPFCFGLSNASLRFTDLETRKYIFFSCIWGKRDERDLLGGERQTTSHQRQSSPPALADTDMTDTSDNGRRSRAGGLWQGGFHPRLGAGGGGFHVLWSA